MGTRCALQGRISMMVWYRSGDVICAGPILRAGDRGRTRRMGDFVRVDARCASGDIGGPIPNHNRRSLTLVVEWRLPTDLLMSTKETYTTMRLPPASNIDIERPPSPSTSPTWSGFCLIACISVGWLGPGCVGTQGLVVGGGRVQSS